MRTSNIFTKAEQKSLEERLNGSKSDKTGIFSARVKPKILEMLEEWLPKKKELCKLVYPSSRTNKTKGVRHSSHQ